MKAATRILKPDEWDGDAVDSVVLAYDQRHRRRIRLVAEGGMEFLLNLSKTAVLQDGDALQLDDGSMIRVHAAREPIMEVAARDEKHRTRLAWHIGNRHLPADLSGETIRLRPDHVIADMLKGLGAEVTYKEAPFHPESGAYADHGHGHDH